MKFSDLNLLDFGHGTQLAGAIYASDDKIYFLPFPDEESWSTLSVEQVNMSVEDWKTLLRQTDLLETEIMQAAADGTVTKAIVRKSTRQIEQHVSWNVYRRDGYACRYCGADSIPLTVDHLVTWESGGPSIEANLLAACRKCNKVRGDLDYASWLRHPHYLRVAEKLTQSGRQANEALVATLDSIPRRVHARSR